MAAPRIVVMGASAGGVEPLLAITRALPRDLPAPVCVVLHVPPHSKSMLPNLIARGGGMPAASGRDGEALQPGRIYVAPPDSHMFVRFGRIRLSKAGPTEHGSRPAIDPLFRSAAEGYGPGAIGIVLSGALDDGTAGLYAIERLGGITIVQSPAEALHPSMPQSAVDNVAIDHVVDCADMPSLLIRLLNQPVSLPPERRSGDATGALADIVTDDALGQSDLSPPEAELGSASGFACPDCQGVLWEIKDGALMRFRCRVGHAYLPESLAAAQAAKLDEAMWIAMRTLRESAALSGRLAERARDRGMTRITDAYALRAREANERASLIERVLRRGRLTADVDPADER